jgi:hypothetical protein
VVGRQEYDFHTQTIRTSVRDPKTNHTRYVTTPAAQNVAPGTVLPQAANSGTDLFTGMAIGSLVNSLFSATAYSKSTDDSDSQKSAYKSSSSSDSSSSWSDSSDSGPSSDW